MVTEHAPAAEPPGGGYVVTPAVSRLQLDDGSTMYSCILTAARAGDAAGSVVFERTLELSEAQAALTNRWRPGAIPTRDQIDAELIAIGVAYMQTLMPLLSNRERPIAAAGTRSL